MGGGFRRLRESRSAWIVFSQVPRPRAQLSPAVDFVKLGKKTVRSQQSPRAIHPPPLCPFPAPGCDGTVLSSISDERSRWMSFRAGSPRMARHQPSLQNPIHTRSCLVQHEDRWIRHQNTGKGQKLPFPYGEAGATFQYRHVETASVLDECPELSPLTLLLKIGVRIAFTSQRQILPDRPLEQVNLLMDDADMVPKTILIPFRQGPSPKQIAPASGS